MAVTLGLPSLSPPIQLPNLMGVALRGSSRPVCFFRAVDSRRRKSGTAAHSDCSTTCRPPRASATAQGEVGQEVKGAVGGVGCPAAQWYGDASVRAHTHICIDVNVHMLWDMHLIAVQWCRCVQGCSMLIHADTIAMHPNAYPTSAASAVPGAPWQTSATQLSHRRRYR